MKNVWEVIGKYFLGFQFAPPPPQYFGLAFDTLPRVEIFGVKALRGRLHQLGSPNLQDIFIGR